METNTMATDISPTGPSSGVPLAKPLHLQVLEKALQLENFVEYVEQVFEEEISDSDEDAGNTDKPKIQDYKDEDDQEILEINGIVTTKAERKADKKKLYNLGRVKKNRRWLKNILLSDSSDSDGDDNDDKPLSKDELHEMLKLHKYKRKCQTEIYGDRELQQYMYYSSGLLSVYDKFPEHQRLILGPKKKKDDKKMKAKLKKLKKRKLANENQTSRGLQHSQLEHMDEKAIAALFREAATKKKHLTAKEADIKRRKIWIAIGKKDIPKAHKQRSSTHNNMMSNAKKLSQLCQKEQRRAAMQSQRVCKETPQRARRITREMMVYWKRYEKVEKEHRKRAEKEAIEQRRLDGEMREAKRQQRKLNFLITQTELYAHFMSRKITGEGEKEKDKILDKLEEKSSKKPVAVEGGMVIDVEGDDYDSQYIKHQALHNAQSAFSAHEAKTKMFDAEVAAVHRKKQSPLSHQSDFSLANPSILASQNIPQPEMFHGQLKVYQLKGMNWLANLYDCGINGILADEMGLGKTVQSIALLAHLAESQSIWGPFLVIAPASTLHNWQQECTRFTPRFKVLPYWGNQGDRKVLRKFWSQKEILHREDAPFHILITSYQLIVQDVRYFQRIKWQYMILDEAQAIKSSSSARWKILLGYNCRNRLLLTGTPIQNSMAELWALLHFIMPTLFDSHEEFNEWFSKDIESHVEKQSGISEEQLSRLHMILKPFMLRRVKRDVENELSDKIEISVYCSLTTRQKYLYKALRSKISIEDLLQSSSSHHSSQIQSSTSSLMNLVMQFRKVCNHPELFEKRETKSPLTIRMSELLLPKLLYREGLLEKVQTHKYKILYNTLYIHSADNIHHSIFPQCQSRPESNCFSFLRFIDVAPCEMKRLMLAGLLIQWITVFTVMKAAYRVYHQRNWVEERNYRTRHSPMKKTSSKYLTKLDLLLWPSWTTSFPSIQCSSVLSQLIFTSYTGHFISHSTQTIHYMAETPWHHKLRLSKMRLASPNRLGSPTRKALPTSPTMKSPLSPTKRSYLSNSLSSLGLTASGHFPPLRSPDRRPSIVRVCQPTDVPAFLISVLPKVSVTNPDYYCSDRGAAFQHDTEKFGGSLEARNTLLFGSQELYSLYLLSPFHYFPTRPGGLLAIKPVHGWSNIQIPNKETLVMDSGKLYVLDQLLSKLKYQGHRVLIYSQMTRMIDILEVIFWRQEERKKLEENNKAKERKRKRDKYAQKNAKKKVDVFGITPPAMSTENSCMSVDDLSVLSVDSAVPSPFSEISVGSSEVTQQSFSFPQDESSNDGLLVVVDDFNDQDSTGTNTSNPTVSSTQAQVQPPKTPVKPHRGRGRPRIKPIAAKSRGPGRPRKKAANSAAAMAGARAGAAAASAAAYAAYGFSFTGNSVSGNGSQHSSTGGQQSGK
ncbi:chromatin-remodeling ATPase INO80 [Saccoglossus kowalevskii]